MKRGCTIGSDRKDEGRKKDRRWERNANQPTAQLDAVTGCSVSGPPVTCS